MTIIAKVETLAQAMWLVENVFNEALPQITGEMLSTAPGCCVINITRRFPDKAIGCHISKNKNNIGWEVGFLQRRIEQP